MKTANKISKRELKELIYVDSQFVASEVVEKGRKR